MNLSKISGLLAVVILFASCVTQKRCLQKFPPSVIRDSIYVETLKEVKVPVKGDTIKIDVPVNCPDQDVVSFIENSVLSQEIKILNGRLTSLTKIKPDTIKIYVPEIHEKIKEVKVSVPQKYIPKVYLIAFYLWIGVIVAVAGYISLKKFVLKK
jgi:hypothetical protein